ncbi:S-adenosyl-L-methionine-dependent methyltransferase [Mycena leptocephala]|nr:S-adenosyl-L-methionine-dependent methyltransferase [Mycena leptocephala]
MKRRDKRRIWRHSAMVQSTYTLKTAQEIEEKNRLDELHFALRELLDDKICFAPIYNGPSPTRILELGCGTGAWAIDAANDFPDAKVVAADVSPTLQGVLLPKNVNFQILDVTQNFPFEEGSFDVVHARLLLMHVPNAKDVLERAAKLVKPGGWFVLEEVNLHTLIESGGPATSRVVALWSEILEARGADGDIGRKMEPIIKNTGSFSEVHTQRVPLPICNNGSAPQNLMRLGPAFKRSFKQLAADWSQRFSQQGISRDLTEQLNKELDANLREVVMDLHFVWARRAL